MKTKFVAGFDGPIYRDNSGDFIHEVDSDDSIYDEGYDDGYNIGHAKGFNDGYIEGFNDGIALEKI